MPPVPAPKTSTKQYPVKLDKDGVWRFKPDEADAQGDTAQRPKSPVTAAEQWLPAVKAGGTDAGAAIDETASGDVIAEAVKKLVDNETAKVIDDTVFNVVKAIAEAVNDGTESDGDEQDDEDDEDGKDEEDEEDNTPLRKKKIARKRERTPEETQPMSPEQKATPSTPDPDESQKVDKDGDDSKIMSPCKKPKQEQQEQQEQRGSDLAVVM